MAEAHIVSKGLGSNDGRLASFGHRALIEDVSNLSTQYDLFRLLKTTTQHYGMRAFMVMRVPGPTTQTLQSASVISNWPSELIARFDRAGMIATSEIPQRLRESTIPFQVDLGVHAGGAATPGHEMFELFDNYKMVRAAIFPVGDPTGERGAIGFFGDRMPLEDEEMMQLLMISTHVYDRLHHVARKDVRSGEALTEREIDCLNWTAAGKTSAEISEILGLSEHTVNHYLNRATRKLDTVNRTQAVAKAIRTSLIS